jgi:hypothetical protein
MSTAQEVKQRVTEKMDHAIEHLKRDLAGTAYRSRIRGTGGRH